MTLQPGVDGKNCIPDEHYLPTFFTVRILFLLQVCSNCFKVSANWLIFLL